MKKLEKKEKPLKVDFSKMKKWRSFQKLKKIILTAIASQLNENDISHLRELFNEIDVNGDGVLTVDEIEKALKKGKYRNKEDILKVFRSMDTDKSGVIDYTGNQPTLTIRIPCCHHGKKPLLKGREAVCRFQAIRQK